MICIWVYICFSFGLVAYIFVIVHYPLVDLCGWGIYSHSAGRALTFGSTYWIGKPSMVKPQAHNSHLHQGRIGVHTPPGSMQSEPSYKGRVYTMFCAPKTPFPHLLNYHNLFPSLLMHSRSPQRCQQLVDLFPQPLLRFRQAFLLRTQPLQVSIVAFHSRLQALHDGRLGLQEVSAC
jgi:hypothetical protein